MFAIALALAAGVSGLWLDVPFVRQEKNGCGAASLAMVMQYWGAQAEAPAIHRALYSYEAGGALARDMQAYLEQHGFRTFVFRGVWRDLQQHLERGRPLIVCLAPKHYVVVAGLQDDLVLINDPARRKLLKVDRNNFQKAWDAAGGWTLLAVPR